MLVEGPTTWYCPRARFSSDSASDLSAPCTISLAICTGCQRASYLLMRRDTYHRVIVRADLVAFLEPSLQSVRRVGRRPRVD